MSELPEVIARKQVEEMLRKQQMQSGDIQGMLGGVPLALRQDGTPKGMGWLGNIPGIGENAGNYMTEYSIGVNIGGNETLIPSIVPTLTKAEIELLAGGNEVTDPIADKAVSHAKSRMAEGKSVWADTPPISDELSRKHILEELIQKQIENLIKK